MKILAFHNFANHDSGAAVLRDDGQRLDYVSISDERLSRVKYSYFFPVRAIDYCLGHFGITSLRDFDLVVSDYAFSRRLLNTNPLYRKLEADYIKTKLDIDYSRLLYVDHHAAHAASAFYPSGFDEAAILVVDGLGSEGNTNSLFVGSLRDGLTCVEKGYGTGIGLIYTLFTTEVLSFGTGEEGKTMGLAAMGRQYRQNGSIVDFRSRYAGVVTDYSALAWRSPSDGLRQPLPRCPDPRAVTSEYYARIASEVQDECERVMLNLAHYAYRKTGRRKLCIAGGVGLNCVANERIVNEGPFDEVFIQPAASDTGIPLGLALYAYHDVRKGQRRMRFRTAFTGRCYPVSRTEALLDRFAVPHRHATLAEVAGAIAARQIVGWHVEGSELGPRALGHRSILADPRHPDMKDMLNAKVKHRELFRPFAPAVLEEKADEYFIMKTPSPFMLLAPMVRPEQRERIPAIVHVDGSARVQTVNAADNPAFHGLIVELEKLTGIPVILNTSFNDNGEPIVETPLDALICFLRTRIDLLYIDGVLVEKSAIADATGLLARLLAFRSRRLRRAYLAAVRRLCPGYSAAGMKAFLKEYHPMHRYFAKVRTAVKLQDDLGSWDKVIYTDRYHLELMQQLMPEEYARARERIRIVEDDYDTAATLEDDALVVLFNTALYLRGRKVRNFYADLSMAILKPLVDEPLAGGDPRISNEYRSSRDWEDFYRRVLR